MSTRLEAAPSPRVRSRADLAEWIAVGCKPKTSWAEEVQDRLFTDPIYSVLGSTKQERKDRECLETLAAGERSGVRGHSGGSFGHCRHRLTWWVEPSGSRCA